MSVAKNRAASVKTNGELTLLYKNHHLAGPFLPQTPISSGRATPERSESPALRHPSPSILVRWLKEPSSSLKLLLLPILFSLNWDFVSSFTGASWPNPFSRAFLLSGHIQTSTPGNQRYQKSWWDILFIAYYIIFFAFVRQSIIVYVARPFAKYFGLRRSKLNRFGEQTYALFYFGVFGAWGYRVMSGLPTYWYNTPEFWKGYPHWDLKAEMKCYYLLQFSHWILELLVVSFGLEKARKDFLELVIHHFVTLWLIGWSYFVNMTYLGNAVYTSMDIPDSFLAFSKLLNYLQWDTAKIYSFILFFAIWSYFRHYLNFWLLWSVWFEFPLVDETARRWSLSDGVYLPDWMKYQIFMPMLLLQLLNLFWYSMMTKILIQALRTSQAEDDRSDDEDDYLDERSTEKED